MTSLVFLDTETTGLLDTDEVWEIGAIRRDPDGSETEFHRFVHHDVRRVARLPRPFRIDWADRYDDVHAVEPMRAAVDLLRFLTAYEDLHDALGAVDDGRVPHLVGAVPDFDARHLANLFSGDPDLDGIRPWHYHLIDVETLVVGWLAARDPNLAAIRPPWKSEHLSHAVGVDPDRFERHTALGDARWAMALYDAVMVTS